METALVKGLGPSLGKSRFDNGVNGKGRSTGSEKKKAADRATLMRQQDAVAAAQAKVSHFEAMLARNSSNAQLAAQVVATLGEARKELDAARAEQARMGRAISGNEAQKKFWGKF